MEEIEHGKENVYIPHIQETRESKALMGEYLVHSRDSEEWKKQSKQEELTAEVPVRLQVTRPCQAMWPVYAKYNHSGLC